MAKPIADDREWIVKHLTPLIEKGKEISQLDTSLPSKPPTYDKGYWTALKLLLLKYYVKPYLDILGSREKALAYVDMFAGPGLDILGEHKVPIPGSPMIPLVIEESKYEFSYFLFCDLDYFYANALRKRCETCAATKDVVILNQDANKIVYTLGERLKKNSITHSLVFVDPEGLDFDWLSLKTLIETIRCDLIVNFPSAGLNRLLGRQDSAACQKVSRFLGVSEEEIPEKTTEGWAIDIFRENLASLGKDISTEIMVRSEGGFHYHLIPSVRQTSTGSPWFYSIFEEAKKRIERIKPKVLGIIAGQIEGTQRAITEKPRHVQDKLL